MAKRERPAVGQKGETLLDLNHLRRETRTALELAVVALAPSELIERLAKSAGLLEAIAELPTDSAPVVALVPGLVMSARSALDDWHTWHREYLEKKIPRG
jgi:hypothetical protein